jgi:hypothetical protein
MTGIPLHRLNIAAIQLEFVGDAGVPQTMEADLRELICLNQLTKFGLQQLVLRSIQRALKDGILDALTVDDAALGDLTQAAVEMS